MNIRLRHISIKVPAWLPLILFFFSQLRAQVPVTNDLDYVNYLITNNQNRDALFFLNQIDTLKISAAAKDSVFHFYGMAHHYLKSLDTAASYFGKVGGQSGYYIKSSFFQSLNNIYANKLNSARYDILKINVDSSSVFSQQKKLQLCGIALLNRNIKTADSLSASFDYASHLYSEEQTSLVRLSNEAKKINKKTPFKAAMLSALVPGLGKYYAGRRGQAVATFFSTLGLAALAGENLYRGGVTSPQFIITGSIFSVFYFGNIVGSAYSVKMVKKKNKDLADHEIRSAVHKPLRRIFN